MEWIELGKLANIEIGKTPARKNSKYWKGDYTWVSIADMKEKYISNSKEKISKLALKEINIKIVPKGTVIMSFKLSIGKRAITEKDLYTNEAISAFHIKNGNILETNYLYYALGFIDLIKDTDRAVMGKTLNKSKLNQMKIPVPSMEIQEKIVKVLDQAQTIIDKRNEQIEALDQLIESIFYIMFGDPVKNEKDWEVKELEEVLLNNVSNIKKDFKDDISYIDIGSINNNNNSIETYNNFKIKNAPSRAKRILNHGDILFSTVRPNLKNIAIFDMYTENTAIGSTGFCIIRVNESLVNNKYIFNVVKNKRFTGYLVKIAEGASYPAVKDSDIKLIKISIPPLSLQNEFAQKVQIIEKQKELLEESLELLDENYKSIMDRAFKGQLFN